MKTVKRILSVAGIVVVAAIILVVVFISPLAKFLFEKYSKPLLGRQIVTDRLTLNMLTGSIAVSGLKIFEQNDTGFAVTCGKLEANISLSKLLHREVEFNKIKLYNPDIKIAQDRNRFSFRDIVRHLSPKKGNVNRSPVKFRLENFSIEGGRVYYENIPIKRIDTFEQVNFSFPIIAGDVPDIAFHIDFTSINGGNVNADLVLQKKSLDYLFRININQFNLEKYYTALRSMLNVASLEGFVTAELNASGTFKNPGAAALSGNISIDDIVIKDSSDVVFTSLHQFLLQIDTLNVAQNIFNFNRIVFDEPYFRFDKYDNGTNLSRMVVKRERTTYQQNSSTAAMSDSAQVSGSRSGSQFDNTNMFTLIWSYAKFIVSNFTISNYKADSILLRDGHFIYADYSMEDRFTYDVKKLILQSGSISSSNKQVKLGFDAVLNHTGSLNGLITTTPNFRNQKIDFVIDSIKVPDFNPYTRHYIGTPFFDGRLAYTSHIQIDTGWLNSENKITIIRLIAGDKIKNEHVYHWPVKLMVSLMKDADGDIFVDLPVRGDLNDPNYHIGKVVWQVVVNFLEKVVKLPLRWLANNLSRSPDDLKEISFEYLQREFKKSQFKKLDLVAKVLKGEPELSAELIQLSDTVAEIEELALYQAKKKYYMENIMDSTADSLTAKDEKQLAKISNKDSLFNAYLNKKLHLESSELISTQQKCIRLIGGSKLRTQLRELMAYRNDEVVRYLTTDKSISADRVKVVNNRDPLKSVGLPQPRYLVNYFVKNE